MENSGYLCKLIANQDWTSGGFRPNCKQLDKWIKPLVLEPCSVLPENFGNVTIWKADGFVPYVICIALSFCPVSKTLKEIMFNTLLLQKFSLIPCLGCLLLKNVTALWSNTCLTSHKKPQFFNLMQHFICNSCFLDSWKVSSVALYLRILGKGLLLKTTALSVFFLWLVKSLKKI